MIEILDSEKCDQCGICLLVCPMDVFRRVPDSGAFRIAYRDDCMTCYDCELECPRGAIDVQPFHKPRVQAFDHVPRVG